MTKIETSRIRLMAETVTTTGQFAVMVGSSVKAFDLTRERAEEWAGFYRGGRVVTMAEASSK